MASQATSFTEENNTILTLKCQSIPPSPVFPTGAEPWRVDAGSTLAKPSRSDARRATLTRWPGAGQWTAEEDGTVQHRLRGGVSLADQRPAGGVGPARVGRASRRQRPTLVPARGAACGAALSSRRVLSGGGEWPDGRATTVFRQCSST